MFSEVDTKIILVENRVLRNVKYLTMRNIKELTSTRTWPKVEVANIARVWRRT